MRPTGRLPVSYLLPSSRRWQQLVRLLVVAGVVFGVAWAVVAFTRMSTEVAVLWPINGVILGICLLIPSRLAGQTLLAAFAGNLAMAWVVRNEPWGAGLALANLVEMGFAWFALRRIVNQYPNLGHPEVLWRFSVFGVLLAPIVSGSIAASLISMEFGSVDFRDVFASWWASHALGMALFAPLVVTFRPDEWKAQLTRERLASALLPWVVLAGVSLGVFFQTRYPLLFLIFPPLIWLVFRWGFAGASLGVLTVAAIGFPLTYFEMGPSMLIPAATLNQRFLMMQVFMGIALLSTLPVGMVLDHRNRLLARLRRREADLEYLASHDPLTKLLNRRGLKEVLDKELSAARSSCLPVSLVVLDVDFFKTYNDTYGHPMGDECLAWLAGEMTTTALALNGHPGRQGGEEFAVVLPGLTCSQAGEWAEVLRQRVESGQREHEGAPLQRLTISLGVACLVPGRDESLETTAALLNKIADRALYQAKEEGRNQVKVLSVRNVSSGQG